MLVDFVSNRCLRRLRLEHLHRRHAHQRLGDIQRAEQPRADIGKIDGDLAALLARAELRVWPVRAAAPIALRRQTRAWGRQNRQKSRTVRVVRQGQAALHRLPSLLGEVSFRLARVIRPFDPPAPLRSFKVQAVGRQCGNELDCATRQNAARGNGTSVNYALAVCVPRADPSTAG
jgi:hypothetical protein